MKIPDNGFIYSLYHNAYVVECKEHVTFRIRETRDSRSSECSFVFRTLLGRVDSSRPLEMNQCKCFEKNSRKKYHLLFLDSAFFYILIKCILALC